MGFNEFVTNAFQKQIFWNAFGMELECEKHRKIKGFPGIHSKIPKFQKKYTPRKTIALLLRAGKWEAVWVKYFWNFGILEFWARNPGGTRLFRIPNAFQKQKQNGNGRR